MEKRYGSILILVWDAQKVSILNSLLSKHASIILGRQGLPVREKGFSLISIIVEATPAQISALSGQIGRIKGLEIKSCVLKHSVGQEKQTAVLSKQEADFLSRQIQKDLKITAYFCQITGKRWSFLGGLPMHSPDTLRFLLNEHLGIVVENSPETDETQLLYEIKNFINHKIKLS